jgi:RNA polymerase sigma factor for flagellar operon FliA
MTNCETQYCPTDFEQRDRIVLEHLPQVRFIARRIHERLPQHVPFEDMVHAGVLGLMDACEKYDPAKQVQFQSYAAFRIRGAILDSLREMDWGPRDLRRKARQVEEVTTQLSQELGRAAADHEVAERMQMSLEAFHHLLGEIGGLELTAMSPASDDDANDSVIEKVADSPERGPLARSVASDQRVALARAISELPANERQVLALYYFEELTMKEVGTVLGVGESRVSQIHSMALVRLRARLQGARDRRARAANA